MPPTSSARFQSSPSRISLFPANLKYLRKRRGLNQEDISSLVHKKPNTVGNWENGKTEPSIPELVAISEFFGINLEDLIRSELAAQQKERDGQLTLWPESGGNGDYPGIPPSGDYYNNSGLPGSRSQETPADGPAEKIAAGPAHGGAFAFMLRELRHLQDRLDHLQTALEQRNTPKSADKSDH